jgi:hypothetical protein
MAVQPYQSHSPLDTLLKEMRIVIVVVSSGAPGNTWRSVVLAKVVVQHNPSNTKSSKHQTESSLYQQGIHIHQTHNTLKAMVEDGICRLLPGFSSLSPNPKVKSAVNAVKINTRGPAWRLGYPTLCECSKRDTVSWLRQSLIATLQWCSVVVRNCGNHQYVELGWAANGVLWCGRGENRKEIKSPNQRDSGKKYGYMIYITVVCIVYLHMYLINCAKTTRGKYSCPCKGVHTVCVSGTFALCFYLLVMREYE